MSKTIIQIDGNNFYASCEQMIDPSLRGKGLVILSNNDGCIISRSAEVRKIGIPMGKPYFNLKQDLNQLNIEVRSANYELYGDISNRLMSILRVNCEQLEVYSIDEAFACITRPENQSLHTWAKNLRSLVYQNIGIPISIGIGNSKVQSKIANHIAKRIKENSGIFDIGIIKNKDQYLTLIEIEKVWGVGKKMSKWLRKRGITNARELKDMSREEIKYKFGIIGVRLQNELKGEICIPLISKSLIRKQVCVSRSFSYPISRIEELNLAISHYVLIASAKLRAYNQLSSEITIFINSSLYSKNYFKKYATAILEIASNDSVTMLKESLLLTKKIFRPYQKITKAGVIMNRLQSDKYQQKILFNTQEAKGYLQLEYLSKIIDSINKKYGNNTLNWASSVINQDWSPRRRKLSMLKTTSLENIPIVFCN